MKRLGGSRAGGHLAVGSGRHRRIFFVGMCFLFTAGCGTTAEKETERRKHPATPFPEIVLQDDMPESSPVTEDEAVRRQASAAPVPEYDDRMPSLKLGKRHVEKEKPVPGFAAATTMRMHVFDVGQGLSALLEFPCGSILVDTGGEKNRSFDGTKQLVRKLDGFFARRKDLGGRLDLLVLTHPHIDHYRGLPTVLEKYAPVHIIDSGINGDETTAAEEAALQAYVQGQPPGTLEHLTAKQTLAGFTSANVDPIACKEVDPSISYVHGGYSETPRWATAGWGQRQLENANNHSVVMRVDFGKSSILITGDLEEPAIDDIVRASESKPGTSLKADIYLVGHHGAANGTTRPLLEAISPRVAIISASPPSRQEPWTAWQYGHPRQLTVDKLVDHVIDFRPEAATVPVAVKMKTFVPTRVERAIYSTGWDGDIVVTMSTKGDYAIGTH